jgi:methylenetetrahydrofolate dehydrogenase (NADP+)/methenyltetrahydrofolate cyclohydrolase
MTNILDGTAASKHIINDIQNKIFTSIGKVYHGRPPKMCIILVGNNPASETYVKAKRKACIEAGLYEELVRYKESVTELEILNKIEEANHDNEIDGIIVQLPLPQHINATNVINAISPEKDIDGFHPSNFGKMTIGQKAFRPATAYGICKLLEFYKIDTFGKHCVVIGRSNIVGKPISIMLGNDFNIGNSTVTLTHINTPRELLLKQLQMADIVIVAVGKKDFLTGDMIKEGCVIVDVGINRLDDGKLVGDVEWKTVSEKTSWITPVPGGVGPMTIAALMINTYNSWYNKYIENGSV